jgi:hypothetical protein
VKDLSVKEVARLLKLLRQHGATSFEGMGLKIALSGENKPTRESAPVSQTKASAEKAAQIEQLDLFQSDAETAEDLLAHALVEDPAEYERLIREGELEDAAGVGTETEEDRGSQPALQ